MKFAKEFARETCDKFSIFICFSGGLSVCKYFKDGMTSIRRFQGGKKLYSLEFSSFSFSIQKVGNNFN